MSNISRHPKIILLGDVSVGKTAILQTLINGEFPQKLVSTMGACFQRYACRTQDGKQISMDIWDTAGQQKYRSLLVLYYKNSDVILMICDASRPQTFETVDFWSNQIDQHCQNKPYVILIANKYDLRRDYKLISDDKIRNYAKNKNWYFFYTSALDNYNIREVFQKAATLAYNNIITKNQKKQLSPLKVNTKKSSARNREREEGGCC